jgi:Ca-activated chloride channel family protein
VLIRLKKFPTWLKRDEENRKTKINIERSQSEKVFCCSYFYEVNGNAGMSFSCVAHLYVPLFIAAIKILAYCDPMLLRLLLQKGSKNNTAKFNLGNSLYKQTDLVSAEKYYDEVTSATDVSLKAKSFYNKGVAEAQQQKLPEAIESFKHALLLTPEDDDTRENLQKAINDLKKQQQQNQPKTQKNKQNQQPQQKNKMPNPEMMEQNLMSCAIRKNNYKKCCSKNQRRVSRIRIGNYFIFFSTELFSSKS